MAQFALDADGLSLRKAAGRIALMDMVQDTSALIRAPVSTCVRDGVLFIAGMTETVDNPAPGDNFRVTKIDGNAVAIETVTTNETIYPRMKMALGLAISATGKNCDGLSETLRIERIDGASSATELLGRTGAIETTEAPQPPATTSAPVNQTLSGWRFSKVAAEGGVEAALQATLLPRSPLTAELDDTAPSLNLRCDGGTVSAFISSGSITWDERPEVTVRLGSGRISTHRWRASSDSKAVGIWTNDETRPFLSRLTDNDSLFLRIRDRNLIYAEFDLANVKTAIDRITQACNES